MDDAIAAANSIKNSLLNYTIVRIARTTNENKINYRLTEKAHPFRTIVSKASVADFLVDGIKFPEKYSFSNRIQKRGVATL
ncbi:NAD(P)H-binding protein [Tetragenococcus halophilus]|uniref:NAD(P)H-binding protein n=1 Tax=Tetragenococcus halophilus TaxID=51669 RepID=UPI000CA9DA4E|nr:NAD(P)H-binding protein [Tetragenococcus halophilus]GBD63104.1 hypothetical protein TEHD23766T_0531 [Tetragenococcus halophilus subsp. flandriensis]